MVPIEAWLAEASRFCQEHGRPLVTVSYAQSLDGSLSAQRGIPTALSGPEAMRLTHRLRAAHDAILVGIGTVLSDDPRLSVRLVEGHNPQPVVLDGQLRFPLHAKLLDGVPSPWIATRHASLETESLKPKIAALETRGARLLSLPNDENGDLSLAVLLAKLATMGVSSLMVEGGSRVVTSFLLSGLADQFVITIAPVFLAGLPAVQLLAQDGVTVFPTPRDIGYDRLGDDLIVWGRLKEK